MTDLILTIGIESVTIDDTGAIFQVRGYNRLGQRVLAQDFMPPHIAQHLNLERLRADAVVIDDRRTMKE